MSTNLGTQEIIIVFIIMIIAIVGNLVFYKKQAGKAKQIKWSVMLYGATLLLFACSLLTPPDITSSIMVSAPLTIAYILLLNKLWFSKMP